MRRVVVLHDAGLWDRSIARDESGNRSFDRPRSCRYQRLWQDSAQIIDPANSDNWHGYGIDQLRWDLTSSFCMSARAPATNTDYGRATDMTLVIRGNLTMALNNKYTAPVLMLKVLDQIYVQTPLPPSSATAAPTTSGG
jgi:hypothetical protein